MCCHKGQFWGWAYMGMPAVGIFNKTMWPYIELLRSLVKVIVIFNVNRAVRVGWRFVRGDEEGCG